MDRSINLLSLLSLLLPLTLSAQISWTSHTITDNFDGACSVHATDINGDNLVDIVAAGWYCDRIALWTNNGGNPITWTQQIIDSDFYGASYVFAVDIDSDDDIDVLGSAWDGGELAWWENGSGNPISWTQHSINATFFNAHEVTATDIDGDNDVDVLGAAALTDEIAWFENNGQSPIGWTKHVIDNGFDGARSVKAADIDGDGLTDVVGAALLANSVTWWRNNGDMTWSEYPIDTQFGMAHMVYSFDIDADGDNDVVAAAYAANTITWWRNDGGNPVSWVEQIIDGSFPGALGVYVQDINNDGNLDILGTADITDDVAWWANDGSMPVSWTKQIIHGTCDGAWPVYSKDIDGDGDNDVIAAATNSDHIYWYENGLIGVDEVGGPYLSTSVFGPTIICGPLHVPDTDKSEIYDITGRRVTPQHMAPGIYFIVIDGKTAGKVIRLK